MVKMVSLKKNAADKRAEKDSLGSSRIVDVPAENEGITVNLDHHHLEKMGVGGGLKAGHKVSFHGEGTVERAESHSGKDGEKHSAMIRLHKGSMEADGGKDEARADLRNEITKHASKADKK